jgi:tRNA(Arg) A34 adenosine deaminase TadA
MGCGEDERFMRMAIEAARLGIERGQAPFGACIVRDGLVLACEHNGVWAETDITAHAEVRAIRAACRSAEDVDLSGTVIYSTCEPCPMCFSAIHWARIGRIVYGASIADARAAGFNELTIPNGEMKRLAGSGVQVEAGLLREAAAELFRIWAARPDARAY